MNLLIEVAVNSAPGVINKTLTYRVPPELTSRVGPGTLVLVTVKKQMLTGVVINRTNKKEYTGLKSIAGVLEEKFLPAGLVELGCYMANHYFCSLAVALGAMLPPATSQRLERRWCWATCEGKEMEAALKLAGCLPAPVPLVAEYLAKHRLAPEKVLQRLGRRTKITRALALLQAHGLVREEWHWRPPPRRRQPRWVIPKIETIAAVKPIQKRAPRQAAILENLLANGPQPAAALATRGGYAALNRLEEQGLIEFAVGPLAEKRETVSVVKLNQHQQQAVRTIKEALGQGGTFLLHGITGSGKTEVYIRCAREALARGYQALILVPEHALIPQMAARLRQGLGVKVVVVHGSLPRGERSFAWEQIRRGEVQVVVGSRSAIFAPLPQLGLIVVDEEHSGSYKQDAAPRYDTREMAIKRGDLEGAVVVMGSATPSIESFYLTGRGRVQRLDLPQRVENLSLPQLEIIDLRAEFRAGHQGILSRRLCQEIDMVLATGKQAILFLNRRGYAPHVICRQCGYVTLCRHCTIALTYHQDAALRCHYCGYVERAGDSCPACGGALARLGVGTQRLEEEVGKLWTSARILRADGDTTARRGQWEKIYHTFAAGQADILIGTQTVAKGMDFPGVTLVGVVNADLSLYQPDFRARERTFQLLTQVAGRAGRKTPGGQVIIQTYNPQDPAIILASTQDYRQFYQQEIQYRQALGYPPFNKLVRLGFSGPYEAKVIETAHNLAEIISHAGSDIEIMGPAPGYPVRVQDNFRWQLMLKVPDFTRNKGNLINSLKTFQNSHRVRIIVDVGPINPW